ncbi:MAG: NADPH-dependent assimilatory sulfite reductase hemoprotein subunit [Xanthomonadaceae bacterium]|nr:NADPH-dependent assimilatory sulfite reductase hemoprotein subunit [Xanthomonadaceae bacterium]
MSAGLDIEKIKSESRNLRGTLIESLNDPTTGAIREADTVVSKFHGLYQQDDRDLRASRREARLEPLYSFMLRVRVPGGRVTRAQWDALDRLADDPGNGSLRLTTRQAIQYHGVARQSLHDLIRGIDAVGMDSLAACGDVNRNVMCHVQPELGPLHAETLRWSERLSKHLTPATNAWREIWIDGKKADTEELEDEPIYGKRYLPRKFKIGIAVAPYNDVDVYSQDIGLVAIARDGALAGFNVIAGGGMGCSHGELETFPLLGQMIGFITPEQLLPVAEAIVTTQRDFGDRENRKHARFKYTLDDRSADWLVDEIEHRCGIRPSAAEPFELIQSSDRYGWTKGVDGRWQFVVFIERLEDGADISPIRRHSMACVAMPTCGLAMAEAERYLPDLISRIEELAARHGISEQPVMVRMSGCPNGCSRPFLGEIGLVGRAPGRYNLYLGAAFSGERLSKLVLDNADEAAILDSIDGWFERYAAERQPDEALGDFAVRSGLVAAVVHGSEVHA